MNYARHRLAQKQKQLSNLSGEQRERLEKKIIESSVQENNEVAENSESVQTESDEILDEAPEPKRRGRPKNAN